MNRNELRVGNFISTKLNTTDSFLYTNDIIKSIHLNSVETEYSGTWSYNQIVNSKITHELLLSFGFEKIDECFYRIKYKNGYSDGWFLNNNNELTKSLSEFYIRLNSVHQLQNLYFSLTQEELKIK